MLEKDIKLAIEKHLPAQVGDLLSNRLRECEVIEVENKKLLGDIKSHLTTIEKLEEKLAKLNGIKKDLADIKKMKADLTTRETALGLTLANTRADEAEKNRNDTLEIVRLVFRSPVYRESISTNIQNQSEYNGNQNYHIKTGENKEIMKSED